MRTVFSCFRQFRIRAVLAHPTIGSSSNHAFREPQSRSPKPLVRVRTMLFASLNHARPNHWFEFEPCFSRASITLAPNHWFEFEPCFSGASITLAQTIGSNSNHAFRLAQDPSTWTTKVSYRHWTPKAAPPLDGVELGGPGRLLCQGSHGPGRADFPHPVRQLMVSLSDRPSARHEEEAEGIPRATDSCVSRSGLFSKIAG